VSFVFKWLFLQDRHPGSHFREGKLHKEKSVKRQQKKKERKAGEKSREKQWKQKM
jgi:hypothetical protein